MLMRITRMDSMAFSSKWTYRFLIKFLFIEIGLSSQSNMIRNVGDSFRKRLFIRIYFDAEWLSTTHFSHFAPRQANSFPFIYLENRESRIDNVLQNKWHNFRKTKLPKLHYCLLHQFSHAISFGIEFHHLIKICEGWKNLENFTITNRPRLKIIIKNGVRIWKPTRTIECSQSEKRKPAKRSWKRLHWID